jgi:hypothetical protein
VTSHRHHNNGKSGLKSVRHANGKSSARKNESVADCLTCGDEAAIVGRGKLVIRCNTPVIVEDLLRDVASKVDIIFDKVSRGEEEEIVKLRAVGDESVEEIREPQEIKLLDK